MMSFTKLGRALLLSAAVAAAVALVVGGCGGDKGAGPSGGYTLTVKRNPANGGTTNPASSQSNISAGEAVNITATAASGYTFRGWTLSGSGTISKYGGATTTVWVDGNVTVTANFAENNNCTSGTTCKQVTIGTQVWMAENLNIATSSGSWCYEYRADSCAKYGRLYDWATAMTVCPAGWHLPSMAEWNVLERFVGGYSMTGKKLKSTSGWYENGNGTDEYGFSALPGGGRLHADGSFSSAGKRGSWRSATENNGSTAYFREIEYDSEVMNENITGKTLGVSVRCVGD